VQLISCPPTELIDPFPTASFPTPRTPALTYSPSSTESSLGDYTIQMTGLSADLMDHSFSAMDVIPQSYDDWSWLHTVPNAFAKACSENLTSSGMGIYPPGSLQFDESKGYPILTSTRTVDEHFSVGLGSVLTSGSYGGGYLPFGADTISCC